jgi:hypothetical protein
MGFRGTPSFATIDTAVSVSKGCPPRNGPHLL